MSAGIIDLHAHTFMSDGVLSPAETVRRAENAGYAAIAITDHADASNLEFLLGSLQKFAAQTRRYLGIAVVPGVELTHVPLGQIPSLTSRARALGAALVVLHGETVTEPVAEGTNRAGIEAGVDILAHPGLITEEDTILAKSRGTLLEITARPGHGLANGHVARMAARVGAALVLNSDLHAPGDFLEPGFRRKVALGAGLGEKDLRTIDERMTSLVLKLQGREKIV
jgi:histidinol phosphatase-like PHP family hydrolase